LSFCLCSMMYSLKVGLLEWQRFKEISYVYLHNTPIAVQMLHPQPVVSLSLASNMICTCYPHCYTCQALAPNTLAFIQGVSTWTPRNHTGNFMAPTVQRSTHFDAAKQAPWPRMLRTPMSEQHHGLTCHITWVPNAGHQLISKLYVQAVQTGSG
jgi:hypothetical protein